MKRFILIDQSITGKGGHYLEYAARVLTAAEQAGYESHLATNRAFPDAADLNWPSYPVYRYAFFVGLSKPRAGRVLGRASHWLQGRWFALKARFLLSRWGVFWMQRRRLSENKALWTRGGWLLPMVAMLLALVLLPLRVLGKIWSVTVRLMPGRPHLERIGEELGKALRAPFAMLRPSEHMKRLVAQRLQMKAFTADSMTLFRRLKLAEGDLVFIPTINDSEMLGLLEFFRRHPESSKATWHLLFRRNIYQGRDPEYAAQDEGLRSLRNTFRYVQENLRGQKVIFYTDTEELTTQYNRLGVFEFHTLPIPVDAEYQCSPRVGHDGGPLQVAYVGDARTEKGYQYLPRLAHDLAADYLRSGRVRLQLQSNFNIPGGEPGPAVARAQLEQFPSSQVGLLRDPLGREAYRDLVVGSDVLLVPYDPFNYYARSSGVLVEAMTAGIPVIVPGGTWMAMQFEATAAEYHQRLFDESERLTPRGAARLRWVSQAGERWTNNGQGSLIVNHRVATSCALDTPRGATHLMVSFRQVSQAGGRFLCTTLLQNDRMGQQRRRHSQIANAGEWRNSVLFPLATDAQRLQLYLEAAYSSSPLELGEVSVEFIAADRNAPISAVGMVYADPDQLTHCVREIVEHIAHYRHTASEFAKAWTRFHNPRVLVGRLHHQAQAAGDQTPQNVYSLSQFLQSRVAA